MRNIGKKMESLPRPPKRSMAQKKKPHTHTKQSGTLSQCLIVTRSSRTSCGVSGGCKELVIFWRDLWCNFWRDLWGFLGGSGGKESACNAGDLGSIPGSGRSPGEGNVNPLQDSCLQNPPWTEEVGHSPWGCKESDMTERLHSHSHDAKREGKGSSP